jgi:hypothetical protein
MSTRSPSIARTRAFTGVLLLFALMTAIPTHTTASELEHVAWRAATVTSAPLPSCGVMEVKAEVDRDDRYLAFSLTAFGRTQVLTPAELARLQGFPLASLQLTREGGYAQLGGPMCHARLTRLRRGDDGAPGQESITVSLPETAELRIDGPFPTRPSAAP